MSNVVVLQLLPNLITPVEQPSSNDCHVKT